MVVELTDATFDMYAKHHYKNEYCMSIEEFYKDLSRIKYIRNLIKRYIDNDDLKERLLLNHLVALGNVFSIESVVKMVFFRLEVDSALNVFGELGLETVPRMYYLPPADVAAAKQSMEDLEIDSRPFMESISSALGHIEKFSKVQVCCLQKLFTKVHN
jgi:hypothetical protein